MSARADWEEGNLTNCPSGPGVRKWAGSKSRYRISESQWWQRQEERQILLQTDLAVGSGRERETDFSMAVIILWNEGQMNTEKGERVEAGFPTNDHWLFA